MFVHLHFTGQSRTFKKEKILITLRTPIHGSSGFIGTTCEII